MHIAAGQVPTLQWINKSYEHLSPIRIVFKTINSYEHN